jgi:hypothetical protein
VVGATASLTPRSIGPPPPPVLLVFYRCRHL